MKTFQNYHRHAMYTNVRISDSAVSPKAYAERAKALGHGILSSAEHGWQGNYFETVKLAKEYGLKPLIGAEAYWVKDRTEKDRTNCHIFLGAKNEQGRQALNDVLSEANLTGFYGQPRLDIPLLLTLPKNDIIVTTACVAYWRYENMEEITTTLANHFGKNFFLEVQYHNTESQRELNKKILKLHNELKIPLIMGCDSHYIGADQGQTRTDFLVSKGLIYPEEDGWFLDYPDGNTAYERFAKQCILSHEEINDAMDNTNVFLEIEEYDSPIFNAEIKMPSLFPDLLQEEKNEKYKDLIWSGWNDYKKSVPEERWDLYEAEIQKEIRTVEDTNMADYFINNYHIIRKGKDNGGWLTKSGRGSAVSFITNMLLGFTEVDRIAAKIHMYPERFMSTTRILQSGSLPDIDFNCAPIEPFARAQQEILGEDHAYPMISFGTMQKSAAWKLYAKSQGIPFEIANAVSDQIKKYETAVKHASEDEKDDVNVFDYVDKDFHEIYEKSKDYLGLVTSWSIAPCFTGESLVYTENGYKPIKNITIGMKVLTHTGSFEKVKYIMQTLNKEIYNLNSIGREIIHTTENHPFYVRTLSRERYKCSTGTWSKKRIFSQPKWIKCKDIHPHDVIATPVNKYAIIPSINGLNEYANNKEFWWMVGRFIGDGWCEHRTKKDRTEVKICCSKKNNELFEISKHITGLFLYRVDSDNTVYKFVFNDNYLYNFLMQFGEKADTKKIPPFVINLPTSLLQSFIEGYISADGHFQKTKNQYIISSTSKHLIYGLQQCIHKVYKVPTTFATRKAHKDIIEGRTVNAKESFSIKFHLDKRRNDHSFYEDGYMWYWVRDVHNTHSIEDVYNLDVANDNSYTVFNLAVHNCSYLLYQGSIRKDIGLVKIKDNLCCLMDGHWAEDCHFLKNDLLKVSVVDLIYRAYHRIGIEPPTVTELLNMCPPSDKAWEIYEKGCTLGINQCEQTGTASRVTKYKPKNISELGAFVAAIRPGFKSMYKTFEERKQFAYGVKAFDELIQTDEMPNSFLLYQEQEMAALNYAGIDMSDCYTAIKNIAKKRADKVLAYKEKFINGFSKVMIDYEHKSQEVAANMSQELWQIIEDSSRYSFNASHSYCVALDSLYGAWLKAHHPLEFYEVLLTLSEQKGDKDKMNALKEEAESYFSIKFPPFRFGQDNRSIKADVENNLIVNSLSAIKGFSFSVGVSLYDCSKTNFTSFVDILSSLDKKSIKASKVKPLITIDYFQQFGNINELLAILDLWEMLKQGEAKSIKKDKITSPIVSSILTRRCSTKNKDGSDSAAYKMENDQAAMLCLYDFELYIKQNPMNPPGLREQIQYDMEILGYADVVTNREEDRRRLLITDVVPLSDSSGNVWSYRIGTQSLGSGKTARLTIKVNVYDKNPIKSGDIVYAADLYKNQTGYWYLLAYNKEA